MISNLSDHTKHAIDIASPATAIGSGAVAVLTLNNVAVSLTILSLLLNIGWMILKYIHLRKHGPDAFWSGGDD